MSGNITPCLERIAIYVHKDNPIRGMTLEQVDAIFDHLQARRDGADPHLGSARGTPGLGDAAGHGSRPQRRHRFASVCAGVGAVLGGEFRKDMADHPDNLGLLKAITDDPRSVGFAGLCYDNSNVRTVPIAIQAGAPFVGIDSAEADAGQCCRWRVRCSSWSTTIPRCAAGRGSRVHDLFAASARMMIRVGIPADSSRPANILLDAVGLGIAH